MKRAQIKKNIKRHIFTHVNRNVVFPILYPVTLGNNEVISNVKIIKINSDGSKTEESHPYQYNNNWFEDNSNTQLANNNAIDGEISGTNYEQEIQENYDMDETFDSHNYKIKKETSKNTNLFTINKNILCDSSSDNVGEVDFSNTSQNFKLDNISYSKVFDMVEERQNIWLYNNDSTENEDTSSNVSSKESTSESISNCDVVKELKGTETHISFISKFNVPHSSLPTLSEVTEPNKQSSDSTESSLYYSRHFNRSINTWLDNFNVKDEKNKHMHRKLSTVSQREKRRKRFAAISNGTANDSRKNIDSESDNEPKHFIDLTSCLQLLNSFDVTKDTHNVATEVENPNNCTNAINNTVEPMVEKSYRSDNIVNNISRIKISDLEPNSNLEKNKNNVTVTRKTLDVNKYLNDDSVVFDYDLETLLGSENNNINSVTSDRISSVHNKELPIASPDLPTNIFIPSLHLSTKSNCKRKTWLRRLFQLIKCCK